MVSWDFFASVVVTLFILQVLVALVLRRANQKIARLEGGDRGELRGFVEGLCNAKLEEVERMVKGLELEWSNAYDKLNSLAGRITKRGALLERALDNQPPPVEALPSDREARRRALQARIFGRR